MTLAQLGAAALLPLLALLDASPSPVPVNPRQSSGFAYATVVGGFFGVALLSLVYFLLNLKPKRAKPYDGPND